MCPRRIRRTGACARSDDGFYPQIRGWGGVEVDGVVVAATSNTVRSSCVACVGGRAPSGRVARLRSYAQSFRLENVISSRHPFARTQHTIDPVRPTRLATFQTSPSFAAQTFVLAHFVYIVMSTLNGSSDVNIETNSKWLIMPSPSLSIIVHSAFITFALRQSRLRMRRKKRNSSRER